MSGDSSDDYYSLLGVDVDADDLQLRRVWRKLVLRFHPDRAGADATSVFQRLSAAYAVLSDPVARSEYDRKRGASAPPPNANPKGGATTPKAEPPRRRAPSVLLSRLSGSLNGLLACGIARRVESDLIELFLTEEEAAEGGMVTISMRVPVRCTACAGGEPSCRRCEGKGATEELFSAWLAVPPEVADGATLAPSELLRGMGPMRFRVRHRDVS